MRGFSFETYKKEKKISIKDDMLKLWKTLKTYKDYNSSFKRFGQKPLSTIFQLWFFCLGPQLPTFRLRSANFIALFYNSQKFINRKKPCYHWNLKSIYIV